MACFKPDKKRKVDSKNREFKTDWTDKYAFVLPVGSTKPMCFICNETVALVKSCNVKRHYETKHAHFEQKHPQNSEVRGRKINHLQSYQATCSVIDRSATKQERAYRAGDCYRRTRRLPRATNGLGAPSSVALRPTSH